MEKPEPNCGGWEDKKKTLLVAGVDVHYFAKFVQSVAAETHQNFKNIKDPGNVKLYRI